MKNILKIIISLSAIAIIGFVGILIYFADEMCENQIYKEYLSPNKSLKAIIFQRDCGATTSFSTQISILDSDEKLGNKSGNIFIIKGYPNEVAPTLNWESDNKLNIQHSLNGNEFKAKNSFGWFNSITITYKTKAANKREEQAPTPAR